MSFVIFYSWQSDLPNPINHGFIGTALEKVVKGLKRDEEVAVDPVLDRDTSGVPGSPDIALTIFSKIDRCQLFIGDVTIINQGQSGRKTSNPNVLVELGYALKTLGPERVVLVMNTAFGGPEDLPFDLKMKRITKYNLSGDATDRSVERKALEQRLDVAVRAVIEHHEQTALPITVPGPPLLDRAKDAVGSGSPQQAALVGEYMGELGARLDLLKPDYAAAERDKVAPDEALVLSLTQTTAIVTEFTGLMRLIASGNAAEAARAVYEGFGSLLERYQPRPPQPGEGGISYRAVDFDFYKFLGHELFVTLFAALIGGKRWATVADLLPNLIYAVRYRHGEPASLHFSEVSKKIDLLMWRKQRMGSRQISIHADLLNARHSEGSLGAAMSATEFMDADYFLFLRSLVEVETERTWEVWLAYSTLYMSGRAPRFFMEAERIARAQEVAAALGVSDIATMKDRVRTRGPMIQGLFEDAYELNPLRSVDFAKIGTRP